MLVAGKEGEVMKVAQVIMFGLAMFWIGLVRGSESPDSMLREVVVTAVALAAAAALWELGSRRLGTPQG